MGWSTNIVTALISSALTPSQNDAISSLNLAMHMNGLEIISVSHNWSISCFMFEVLGIVVTP